MGKRFLYLLKNRWVMDEKELSAAIDQTKDQIYQIKQQIEETSNPQEKSRLQHKLKELQYLQLWHLDQLG